MIDLCNYISARFDNEYYDITGSEIKRIKNSRKLTKKNRMIPFESHLANLKIDDTSPIHPENLSKKKLDNIFFQLDEVVTGLIMEPDRIFHVSPKDLEKIVAEVYHVHGFDIKLTGGPHDHGVDIAATAYLPLSLPKKLEQHIKIGIQVKRYKSRRKVSEKEVRDLFGCINADNFDRGIIVTTSSLTSSAIGYIKSRRTVQDRICIIDGENVMELLISYCKQKDIPFWENIR